ncbi:BcsR/BcsP family cellulose biosynthesis protein [Pseudoalteromonas sp.]|uniref:BcsR/BcsP family cellulose biosynthesis protein n=1 Tax=Pseudoalteromonas sp. TaxID=53249 RepID=UPI003564D0C1
MQNIVLKDSQTLTSNDVTNLSKHFGGRQQDYVEIVNTQYNKATINKYPLLKDIERVIANTSAKGGDAACNESL